MNKVPVVAYVPPDVWLEMSRGEARPAYHQPMLEWLRKEREAGRFALVVCWFDALPNLALLTLPPEIFPSAPNKPAVAKMYRVAQRRKGRMVAWLCDEFGDVYQQAVL